LSSQLRRRIGRPSGRWPLLAFLAAVLIVLLLVQGGAMRSVGASGTPLGRERSAVAGAQPLLTVEGGRLLSRQPPPGRRVALTFDDGPARDWTPRIARELRRLHAPATFFLVGSQVVRHPGIVGQLHRDGFELGNHSFTHADVSRQPGWLRSLEVEATENAVAAAAGVRPRLFRPPYSSTTAAVRPEQTVAFERLAEHGYVLALSDLDGRDWDATRDAEAITRSVLPRGKRGGGIVLLHDGGGDRARTLAAVPRIVRRLRAQGFRLVPVSELLGVPRSAVELPASGWQRLRGQLLMGTLEVAGWVTAAFTALLVPIAVLMVLRAALVVVLARRHARRRRAAPRDGSYAPSASIVVPAFNEAVGIERAVRSFAASDYPDFEVLVVDDGPTDGTGERAEALGLTRVRVIRQANAGKPAALNRGIAAARNTVVVMVDADTVFERDSLRRIIRRSPRRTSVPYLATPRWAIGAGCSGAGSTSSTSWASTSTAACSTSCVACRPCLGRSAPSAARRSPRWAASPPTRSPRTPT
jgi:peptidoglycan/xylan/chitin deacetylase (PgdA/CDA1 family)